MRSLFSLPMSAVALLCWSVSIGDKVEGAAILFAHDGKVGSMECGASVSGDGCPSVGFAIGSDDADRAYDRIVKSAPADRYGFIQSIVYLSGDVIPNGATGKPMIRASHLRLAESGKQNGR
jgi:hypothetical protein